MTGIFEGLAEVIPHMLIVWVLSILLSIKRIDTEPDSGQHRRRGFHGLCGAAGIPELLVRERSSAIALQAAAHQS